MIQKILTIAILATIVFGFTACENMHSSSANDMKPAGGDRAKAPVQDQPSHIAR